MDEDEIEALTCKVVLVGESRVGKASIISKYIPNIFESQLMSTPGANFVTKTEKFEEENKSIKFEILGYSRSRKISRIGESIL